MTSYVIMVCSLGGTNMDNRKELTNRRIREAYKRELEEDPEHSPSIKAICITSGINRTTFYRYYQSVDDLELHLIIEWIDEFVASFPADANPFDNPELYFQIMLNNHVLRDNFVMKVMKARGRPLPQEALDHLMAMGKKKLGKDFDDDKLVFAFAGGLAVILCDRKRNGEDVGDRGLAPLPPEGEPPVTAKDTVVKICGYYRALKDA